MTHEADSEDDSASPGIVLPKWFLVIGTGLFAVLSISFIPWSIWVTNAILQNTQMIERMHEHSQRIDQLENKTNEHAAQLQVISATRFTSDHGEAIKLILETKMDRLSEKMDTKFNTLQRDFDRRFGVPMSTPSTATR